MALTPVPVVELVEDWLTAKRALGSAAQAGKGNSDRARRSDLERWAIAIGEAQGLAPSGDEPLVSALALSDLSEEVLVQAMAVAKSRWSDATVARMLSTLRGFTRWAHRRGHLAADPLDADLFQAPPRPQRRPRAPEDDDVERIRAAATEEPRGRQRMFWPARDAALVRFLASTGARAEEVCGATIGELDRRAERPIWRVGRSKGDKTRDVPLPRSTVEAIDEWLAERAQPAKGRSALPGPADRSTVRAAWRQRLVPPGPRPVGARPGGTGRGRPSCRGGGPCLPPPLRRHLGAARRPRQRHLPADGPRRSPDHVDLHDRRVHAAHHRPR